ncbi:MAG: putative Ig domain-containing protein [Patescibacteria group bacterium]
MKKLILTGVLSGLLLMNLTFVNVAEARHHNRPWCYILFQKCDRPGPSSSSATNTNANDAPVWAGSQETYNVKIGQLLQFTVNAIDPENDPLTYSAHFLPSGASFNTGTKIFSWTPNNIQDGTHLIEFSVSDGQYRVSQVVTIIVDGKENPPVNTNSKPVWDHIGDKTVVVGQTLQFSVWANDTDGHYLNYSVLNLPLGANFNPYSRIFSWTPNSNQLGSHVITFRVADSYYTVDNGVTIAVISNAINRAPSFVNFNPPAKGKVGQPYSYDLSAVDPDNDPITFGLISGPIGMSVNPVSGLIQWTPSALQANYSYALVSVSDGKEQAAMGFYIFTENLNVPTPITPTTPTTPIVAAAAEKDPALAIANLEIAAENGEVIISWKTNLASRSRVIYDTVSQAGRAGNFTYANATRESQDSSTRHRVNIKGLKTGAIYYFRAVSKTNNQTEVSAEIAFTLLPSGQASPFFGASIFNALGPLLFSPEFLLLVIIGLIIWVALLHRKYQKLSSPL